MYWNSTKTLQVCIFFKRFLRVGNYAENCGYYINIQWQWNHLQCSYMWMKSYILVSAWKKTVGTYQIFNWYTKQMVTSCNIIWLVSTYGNFQYNKDLVKSNGFVLHDDYKNDKYVYIRTILSSCKVSIFIWMIGMNGNPIVFIFVVKRLIPKQGSWIKGNWCKEIQW